MELLHDRFLEALTVAATAPSSHNCQPWGLGRVVSSSAASVLARVVELPISLSASPLVLALDRDRTIGTLEAHRLEMTMSCGMYIEAFARGWGGLELLWVNEEGLETLSVPGWPPHWRPLAILRSRAPASSRSEPTEARRVTNRGPYLERGVSAESLARLRSGTTEVTRTGPAVPVELVTIDDRATIERAAAFIGRHAHLDFTHPRAWAETYRYFRVGSRDAREAEDGLPLTQLFGPLSSAARVFYGLVLAPTSMRVLRYFGFAHYLARRLQGLFAAAPTLVAVTVGEAEPGLATQLRVGAFTLSVWERASREGLAIHPLSVVLQHPDLRRQLQELLRVDGRICFFGRLGYPAVEFPPAPKRRPTAAVVEL